MNPRSIQLGYAPVGFVVDQSIGIYSSNTRLGFPARAWLTVENVGNRLAPSRPVSLYHPPELIVVGSSSPWTVAGAGLITWELDSQMQFDETRIYVDFHVPNTYSYDSVQFDAILDFGDYYSGNDSVSHVQPITGSYDPNDKQVIPSGVGPLHVVDTGTSQLIYTIRFQNTGNDTAFTVVLHDTLSPYVIPGTIQTLSASHDYVESTYYEGIYRWTFNDIYLPDSTTDLLGSQGYVTFQIDVGPDLPLTTIVSNSAGIVFDFNDPIITNDAWVSLGSLPTDYTGSATIPSLQLQVYYLSDAAKLSWAAQSGFDYQLSLFALDGKLLGVQDVEPSGSALLTTTNLPKGMLIAQIRRGDGVTATQKVMIR